jgi:two-component system cell cycle sensor histidine kinase/response regulator CckA
MPGEKLETILVVDDDDVVLDFVVQVLKMAQFVVLQATGGTEAIKVAAEYAGKIDLLLSDVRMPEISGPDLAEAIKKSRPDLQVMFMSGFARGDLLMLNYGWAFIGKPFVPIKLIEMIYVVLHAPDNTRQFLSNKDTGTSL